MMAICVRKTPNSWFSLSSISEICLLYAVFWPQSGEPLAGLLHAVQAANLPLRPCRRQCNASKPPRSFGSLGIRGLSRQPAEIRLGARAEARSRRQGGELVLPFRGTRIGRQAGHLEIRRPRGPDLFLPRRRPAAAGARGRLD